MPDNPIILDIQGNDGFELEFEDSEDLDFETQPYSKGDPGKSAYQVAVDNGFSGTEAEWLASLVGPQGSTGATGPAGNGVASVALISTVGLVKTYRMTFTNGTYVDFSVTDGDKGDTGDTGPTGNGIASVTLVSTVGKVKTYRILFTNGTHTDFTVTDGADGSDGTDGSDGADGFSPTATVTKSGSVATITITDKNGTTTANVYDGSGGGGNVNSVNGQTGDVVLDADDVGAAAAVHTHTVSDVTDFPTLATVATSGSYNDLTNKPTIPTVPTKLSDFTDDLGSSPVHTHSQYLTSYTETDPVFSASASAGITSSDITNWNNKSDFSGDYDDLTDKPEIDDVYWCTYGTTTSAEIETALTAGKIPMVKYQDYVYTLRYRNSATNHRFVCNYGGKEKSVVCQSGTWMPNGDLTFLTTSYTAPVTSVNGQTGAVTVSVPTKVSDLTNDAGYISSYTETDPVFSASAAAGITSSDISDWGGKAETDELLKMQSVTVASSGWTAGTLTSASGTSYTYYKEVSVTNMTANDFVDISNMGSASSYTGNYAVQSLSGKFRIWVSSQPSASTTWYVYYKVGMTATT